MFECLTNKQLISKKKTMTDKQKAIADNLLSAILFLAAFGCLIVLAWEAF
jgi:hypothetical protein